MTTVVPILLLVLVSIVPSIGQDGVDTEYAKGLEARTRTTKERMAEIDRKAKPEEGVVAYIVLEGDRLAPAFLNWTLKTLHRWNGVILKVVDVPEISGWPDMEVGGPPIIWSRDLPLFTVKTIPPPVRYLQLDDGSFIQGYYDHTSRILYQNANEVMRESELPAKAVANKLVVDRSFDAHRVKLLDGRVLTLSPVPQKRQNRPQIRR